MEQNKMAIFALLNTAIDACGGHVVFNSHGIKSASTGDDFCELILQDGTTRHVADILDDEDLARKVLSAISIKVSMKRSTDKDFQ